MNWKVWDGDWSNDAMVARAVASGASAFQNGFHTRYTVGDAALFNSSVQVDAARAAAAGLDMHIYVQTYDPGSSTDDVRVADFQAVADPWPASVKAVMFDSEHIQASDYYDAWLAEIPTDVTMLTPDSYPNYIAASVIDHTGLGHPQAYQEWRRITGYGASLARMTNLAASCYIAAQHSKDLWVGAQAWATNLNAPTPRKTLQASVYLVALASGGTANGTHWGMSRVDVDTWNWLKAAYETVNALDWTGLTPEAASVAVLMHPTAMAGLYNATSGRGVTAFWEMMFRANIPFELIWDADCTIANLAQYSAVVAVNLTEEATQVGGPGSGTLYDLSATAQAALENFATVQGKPVLAQCSDASWYGNTLHWPHIPAWATVLTTGRTLPEIYPTFSIDTADGPYQAHIARLAADYVSKVGITPYSTHWNQIVRHFTRAGNAVTVTVDTENAVIAMEEAVAPAPSPGPTPDPPQPEAPPATGTRIMRNARRLTDWTRNWQILAANYPTMGLDASPVSVLEVQRNFRIWTAANPNSSVKRVPLSDAEVLRAWQKLSWELYQ